MPGKPAVLNCQAACQAASQLPLQPPSQKALSGPPPGTRGCPPACPAPLDRDLGTITRSMPGGNMLESGSPSPNRPLARRGQFALDSGGQAGYTGWVSFVNRGFTI
jgi:hypothetical protein